MLNFNDYIDYVNKAGINLCIDPYFSFAINILVTIINS